MSTRPSRVSTKKRCTFENECEKERETLESRFKDMPEWEGERYRGEGIKRMKGYKCDLNIDELYLLREEFWQSKINTRLIWKHIKGACLMDDGIYILNLVRSLHVIKQLDLKPIDNCINHLVDFKGLHYHIPNFCVNDPFFEKEIKADAEKLDHIVRIYLFDLYENKKFIFSVSLSITGKELKQVYFSEISLDESRYKSRLLFGGCEIQDEHKLFQHSIMEDYQIQIIKNLIEL